VAMSIFGSMSLCFLPPSVLHVAQAQRIDRAGCSGSSLSVPLSSIVLVSRLVYGWASCCRPRYIFITTSTRNLRVRRAESRKYLPTVSDSLATWFVGNTTRGLLTMRNACGMHMDCSTILLLLLSFHRCYVHFRFSLLFARLPSFSPYALLCFTQPWYHC
jgi:hypothetical protein